MMLAPYFRRFELPWAPSEESERKFKRMVTIFVIIVTILACMLWAIPKIEVERFKPQELKERVAQLIVEKPKPPPPPPPPPEEKPKPEDKPKPTEKPVEKPKPNVRNQGMLALADELAELRDQNLDLQDPQMKAPVEDARSERNLIVSSAGRASGGINTSNMSRGFGGGAGQIGTHTSTAVQHGSGLDPNAGGRVQRTGNSGKSSRAREEVEIVFDRNKGALYALYGRALARPAGARGQAGAGVHDRAVGRDHDVPRGVERAQGSGAREEDRGACAPDPLQARGRRTAHRQQTHRLLPRRIVAP